jgi:SAM-dependent methyltransferase
MSSAYSLPQIYDIAFDWRDVPGEVDFLLAEAEKHLGRKVTSALELACGPAYHTREIARRGIISDGMDLSPEMVSYAHGLVTSEKLPARVFQGDMRTFRSDRTYDLVYVLLVSFAHLLTNQDILDNLEAAASLLNEGGVYIISTAHPRDFYDDTPLEKRNETIWTAERDGITVVTDWGGSEEKYDPLTEIDEVTISYTVTQDGRTTRFESQEKLRRLSFQTLRALFHLNGELAIANLLGDFDQSLPLTNAEESVRMVVVAQKR